MNHYFTDNTDLKHNICEKKVSINGHDFVFFTDNGVFSKNGLDFGTRSLLESLPDYIHGDVLDFGCGYGPIGIYLKKIFNCNVDMIDINNRSIELAIKNNCKTIAFPAISTGIYGYPYEKACVIACKAVRDMLKKYHINQLEKIYFV